jgi:hypothetical protein
MIGLPLLLLDVVVVVTIDASTTTMSVPLLLSLTTVLPVLVLLLLLLLVSQVPSVSRDCGGFRTSVYGVAAVTTLTVDSVETEAAAVIVLPSGGIGLL